MSDAPAATLPPLDCDLLVIGSGAAGLACAVTAAWHGLKVIVVEKDSTFGGASAWSGGWMWVPGNPLARRAGIHENPQQPRTYLKHELGERYDAARIDAFLDNGPQMVAFFEQHTALQFVDGNGIPDIHGQVPGMPVTNWPAGTTAHGWPTCRASRSCSRPWNRPPARPFWCATWGAGW